MGCGSRSDAIHRGGSIRIMLREMLYICAQVSVGKHITIG